MHGILTRWRLRVNENFKGLVDQLSAHIAESEAALPGYVAGYAVGTGLDTMATFNVYETAIDAEVASHALALVVMEAMEGHAQIIEQHSGPVHELRPRAWALASHPGEI